MPPEETSSLSVGVPPRSIAHLDPVRFMSPDDERAAASGAAFALGERAPWVANKSFEISKFKYKISESSNLRTC